MASEAEKKEILKLKNLAKLRNSNSNVTNDSLLMSDHSKRP